MMAAYVQGRQVSFTKARAVALEFELYTIFSRSHRDLSSSVVSLIIATYM